jgi:hypothetical protein
MNVLMIISRVGRMLRQEACVELAKVIHVISAYRKEQEE